MMAELSFIEQVKTNNREVLSKFYNEEKLGFLNWAKSRFDCDNDTIIDVYQDSIVTLYHNIIQEKIVKFDVSPGAYLFGIARNLMLKRIDKNKKTVLVDQVGEEIKENIDYDIYDRIDDDHKRYEIGRAFKQLKDACRQILTLFYYQKYSIEAIMYRLNYSNVNVVKTRKNQCMNNLKAILTNIK